MCAVVDRARLVADMDPEATPVCRRKGRNGGAMRLAEVARLFLRLGFGGLFGEALIEGLLDAGDVRVEAVRVDEWVGAARRDLAALFFHAVHFGMGC